MAVVRTTNASSAPKVSRFASNAVVLHHANAVDLYRKWEPPVVIVSDGPYGLGGVGDLPCTAELPGWYEPHVERWAAKATALTTLWFWNTEIGWATVHAVLSRHGWVYRQCCIWDKGLTHVTNHTNTRTLRKLPTVTEVCVQYIRSPEFRRRDGAGTTTQGWLRSEWTRSGLPYVAANKACGGGEMARGRYLRGDHCWYCPPPRAFALLAAYANSNGDPKGRPYFSLDGVRPLTAAEWKRMSGEGIGDWERHRGKFFCEAGLTNVWRFNPVRGSARVKTGSRSAHRHQKPISLMERALRLSSEPGDLVWEPFGGLFTVAIAAARLGRKCVSAEIRPGIYRLGVARIEQELGREAKTQC